MLPLTLYFTYVLSINPHDNPIISILQKKLKFSDVGKLPEASARVAGLKSEPGSTGLLTRMGTQSLRFHHTLSSLLMFLNEELGILALGLLPCLHF